jgi:hypothetical protein
LGRKGIGRRMLNFFIAIDKEKINVVNWKTIRQKIGVL